MPYYSKYTGAEIEEKIDKIEEIPTLIAEILTGKEYVTKEDLLCILRDYAPKDYSTIPIDGVTIYWDNGVLKSLGSGGGNCTCLWELRETSDGQQYLYSRLPVATQYDITSFVNTNNIDLPSLYDGIPIDNDTIYWEITEDGVKLLKAKADTESIDREEVLDIISNLNYATKDWVNNQNFINSGTLTSTLKNYVTIEGDQDVLGIKNFKKGLKIADIPITKYDAHENTIYIDGNVVLSGGLVSFVLDDDDIPSILDSLPIASDTTLGIASFDSNYFSVSNGVVSLINTSSGLDEVRLKEYLDTNKYVTQSWIIEQNYATYSSLGAISAELSNKISKSEAGELFVTLDSEQTITGKKDFTTGGLFVNGKQIQYDATNGCWKLEGNLLVTGGVTMYADGTTSGGSSAYSTLGSLLNVDDSIDASASVDRVLFQAAGSSKWVTKPLSEIGSSSGGTVSGDYLPLSGGTLTGNLTVSNSSAAISIDNNSGGNAGLNFQRNGTTLGCLRLNDTNDLEWLNTHLYQWDKVLTASNYSSYALPLSGGTINGTGDYLYVPLFVNALNNQISGITFKTNGTERGHIGYHYELGMRLHTASTAGIAVSNSDVPIFYTGNGSVKNTILHSGNISSYNAGSATKLQTAKTIWGQSFDGSGNVDGAFITNASVNYPLQIVQKYSSTWTSAILATNSALTAGQHYNIDFGHSASSYNAAWVGYYHAGVGSTSNRLSMGLNSVDDVINILATGNVGIGTTAPLHKLHVCGKIMCEKDSVNITTNGTNSASSLDLSYSTTDLWQLSARFYKTSSSENNVCNLYYYNGTTWAKTISVSTAGNMTVLGGITMYSDQRKKTILNHVELSLSQIANAPLIEHYYLSDENKTTHVGSIAQYWAGLNDWFCKKDAEGFYTMEIQNAALASAISIARHLERYESKTDKKIRQLKKRISQLEDEIELLKKGA